MEAVATRAEEVAERRNERMSEPKRGARERLAESGVGGGAGGPVEREPGPALEATQRPVGVCAEVAVERPRRKAVPRERELERCDVPAAGSERELSPPQRATTAVAAHRLASPRAGNSVGREPCSTLEPPHRLLRPGAEDAVHGSRVETARPQTDLERRDVRAAARESAAREAQRENGQHGNRCR